MKAHAGSPDMSLLLRDVLLQADVALQAGDANEVLHRLNFAKAIIPLVTYSMRLRMLGRYIVLKRDALSGRCRRTGVWQRVDSASDSCTDCYR